MEISNTALIEWFESKFDSFDEILRLPRYARVREGEWVFVHDADKIGGQKPTVFLDGISNTVFALDKEDPLSNGQFHDKFSVYVTVAYDGDAQSAIADLMPIYKQEQEESR